LGLDLRLAQRGDVVDQLLRPAARSLAGLPAEMERPEHDPRRVGVQALIQDLQRTIRKGSFDAHPALHSIRAAGRARALAWNNGRVERREWTPLHSFRSLRAD